MQDISLRDNKAQHYKQKLYNFYNRCYKCPPFAELQRHKHGGSAYNTALLYCR